MEKKSLTLVAGTEQTRRALVSQLKEYISDIVQIKSFAIDEGLDRMILDDLVILSSSIVAGELEDLDLLAEDCEVIVAKRTIGYDVIDQIVSLPEGTEVLFVNDIKETAEAGIKALKELGIDHLTLIPYYPGHRNINKKAKIAITPGECDKIPSQIDDIYNIGPRIMDFTTIIKILIRLDILEHKAGQFSRHYLQKIINIAKKLASSVQEISNLNRHLNLILNGLNEPLVTYDFQGNINFANGKFKEFINKNYDRIIDLSLQDLIFKKDVLKFLMDKDSKEEQIFSIDGIKYIVNRCQLAGSNNLVAVFKSVQDTIAVNEKLRGELVKKGFYAKYDFSDIIGQSRENRKVKRIAKKLAVTDLTILIEGESGTGKELFASAIHNSSRRKNGPFLAVNFSALPDELIESELFGYEEGAFTGARKGGKQGLFEQANGGTIFLDEIGDISPKVQARLLRVLQEKEVMRIGGNKIKAVDVRIIAATNRDLAKLVDKGEFREDLYYRLKMGYIKIPPLRKRKEDIVKIMNYFIKVETAEDIKMTENVISELLSYDWYGNVRELKNTLNYMLAVRENNKLTLSDIPERDFFQKNKGEREYSSENYLDIDLKIDKEKLFILRKIKELNEKGLLVGRRNLAGETEGTSYEMTEHQMRNRLDKLEKKGLIIKKRGRHGTVLSKKGKHIMG